MLRYTHAARRQSRCDLRFHRTSFARNMTLSAWCRGACVVLLLVTAALLVSTARAHQEPPGTNSVHTDQEPRGVGSAHTGQQPRGTSSVHTDQEPRGVGSAHTDQESRGTSSAHTDQEPPGAPRCWHPRCRFVQSESDFKNKYYEIEDEALSVNEEGTNLWINCIDTGVLSSPALPRFEPARREHTVSLIFCPPPATGSLRDTFARLNVSFCEQNASDEEPCKLEFFIVPGESLFTGKIFDGLERLQVLDIASESSGVSIGRDFFRGLNSLRSLWISYARLPAELDALPPSLEELVLSKALIDRLPKAIYASTTLSKLDVWVFEPLDAVAVPPGLHDLKMRSSGTTLRLDEMPMLVTLELGNWLETMPQPVARCSVLRKIHLQHPEMHALPHRWLEKCARLEQLIIEDAWNMFALPPKLFSPDNSVLGNLITDLSLLGGALETLPAKLEDVRHLKTLNLKGNHIKTIPSDFFSLMANSLSELNLAHNDLHGNVSEALKSILWYYLTKLDLSYNPRIGDLCSVGGDSPVDAPVLSKLLLEDTGVTRICRDWREKMPYLDFLELSFLNISELSYEDLQFKRLVESYVGLYTPLTPVITVRITREDFNKAKKAPPSFTIVNLNDKKVVCDCTMYWARRGLEHPRAKLALPGVDRLSCIGGELLTEKSFEDMVCPARKECAAAALPAGCACVARPDEDEEQDRWLVRTRCENSTQGLVPRRIYPFYPIHKTNSQGVYLSQRITYFN